MREYEGWFEDGQFGDLERDMLWSMRVGEVRHVISTRGEDMLRELELIEMIKQK